MRDERTRSVSSPSPRPSPIRERGQSRSEIVRLTLVVALAVVAYLITTLLALEGREVVVLRTFDAAGQPRETRTWVADEDGFVWIESANPERTFYRDVLANPRVQLERGGVVHGFIASVEPNPEGHRRIRRLLAAKYRWADRWIALLADTSGSIALRLEPVSRNARP
jgi:hypothetical protein